MNTQILNHDESIMAGDEFRCICRPTGKYVFTKGDVNLGINKVGKIIAGHSYCTWHKTCSIVRVVANKTIDEEFADAY